MNPSTLQTISQIGVVVGLILTGLGGFGAYYYGKVVDEQKDKGIRSRLRKNRTRQNSRSIA